MSAGYASVPTPRLGVMSDAAELLDAIRAALRSGADPERAVGQQRYMKSEMPFLGLTSPQRHALLDDLDVHDDAVHRDRVRERHQVRGALGGLDAGDKALEHGGRAVALVEHDAPVVTAQAHVDVAGVAIAMVELRHEAQRLAVVGSDLLGTVLVDRVLVPGADDLVELEGDIVLAEVALALR